MWAISTLRWQHVILLLLLFTCVTSIGCRGIQVIRGTDEVFYLKQGDPAPITGYLLSPQRLSKLYEQARIKQHSSQGPLAP